MVAAVAAAVDCSVDVAEQVLEEEQKVTDTVDLDPVVTEEEQ